MSVVFEGFLVPADAPERVLTSLLEKGRQLGLQRHVLGGQAVLLERVTSREELIFSPDVDRLATEASRLCGTALVVRWDDREGLRLSTFYVSGDLVADFGEAEELFVPLDEDGQARREVPPIRFSELLPDQEYETSSNAIQLGLERFGPVDWGTLFDHITGADEEDPPATRGGERTYDLVQMTVRDDGSKRSVHRGFVVVRPDGGVGQLKLEADGAVVEVALFPRKQRS